MKDYSEIKIFRSIIGAKRKGERQMTSNSFFKCKVCGTVFRLRFQVGYSDCPIAFACPNCLTEISGLISVHQKPPDFSFKVDNVSEVGECQADYVLELSSEFLTHKMIADDHAHHLPPFLRNIDFTDTNKTARILQTADEIENRLKEIKIVRDLYNNGKYDYLERMLDGKSDDMAAALRRLPNVETGYPEVDSLSQSHKYILFSVEKTLGSETFSSINSLASVFESLLGKFPGNLFSFASSLGGALLKENRRRMEDLIVRFATMYRGLLPLYLLDWDLTKTNLETDGITTVGLKPLHEFYKDAFETICDSIDVAIGLNNIAVRNDYQSFTDGHYCFVDKMRKYGFKSAKAKSLVFMEPFSFPFVSLLDNTIRNSESHFSSKYNVLSQMVTFKDSSEKKEMYLAEFACKCFEVYCSMCILWDLLYQMERIYLIREIKP
jgi:hypothetical protein